MSISIIGTVSGLLTTLLEGVCEHFKGRQEIKKAVLENKIRLASSSQEFNQAWEMKQLENSGWKDDLLFYSWLAFFIWSGFAPEQAAQVLKAWEALPEWFLKITFWIVAAVLGVKKLGDYLPGTVHGLRKAFLSQKGEEA